MGKKRIVDPIHQGIEEDMFWRMVEMQMHQFALMEAGIIPTPPEVVERAKARYRVTYICGSCDNEHRIEGNWQQVGLGVQGLIMGGNQSVTIETLPYAMQRDVDEADDIEFYVNPKRPSSATPDLTEFFTRKP